jgi:hypothetical protein
MLFIVCKYTGNICNNLDAYRNKCRGCLKRKARERMDKELLREKIAEIIREHFDCGTLVYQGEAHRVADRILALLPEYVEARIPEKQILDEDTRTAYVKWGKGYNKALADIQSLNPGLFTKEVAHE